ncbi:MAG TPA: hemolysin family protein [Fibrobacteraceae bacterium]|nr:hemolysin family protein [Fibrobacteraceae bacterium]
MLAIVLSILFALVSSAFCSLSEASFYSVPQSVAEQLAQRKPAFGRYLLDVKNNMERYIASVLILNTLANTFGVFWATLSADQMPPYIRLSIPWVMTVLILLFGEITPKTIGVRKARHVAPVIAVPFYYLTKLLGWTGLIRLCLSVTRRMTGDNVQAHTPDDIKGLADIGVREGIIDYQQAQIIKNILALKSMTVRSVMTPRQVVFSLAADVTIEAALQERGSWPFSRVPLYGKNKDSWVGQVLRRDAYNALVEDKGSLPLRRLMRPLQFVPDSMNVDALLRKFLKQRAHMVGVVDEYGSLAGIASLEDVLEGLLGREIVDEFDEAVDLQEQARRKSIAFAAIRVRRDLHGHSASSPGEPST